jgi:hypothetical protein
MVLHDSAYMTYMQYQKSVDSRLALESEEEVIRCGLTTMVNGETVSCERLMVGWSRVTVSDYGTI